MSKSPNGLHNAELNYQGEIRFGPEYYTLSLDSVSVKGMTFGGELQWSEDSRYLAAEEWLSTDFGTGPVTRAVIFDLEQGCFSTLKTIDQGYAQSFCFAGNSFIYKKNFQGRGQIVEVEILITDIHNWQKLGA